MQKSCEHDGGDAAPNPYRFTFRLRVRWGECDMQGIVFNPHYMAYVDVALTEYWRAVGLPYPQAFADLGTDTFMVAANQTYADAARFDDKLDVCLRTEYLGNTSLRLAFAIYRNGARLFHGSATYVNGDRVTRRPVPLSDMVRQRIDEYEAYPPSRK